MTLKPEDLLSFIRDRNKGTLRAHWEADDLLEEFHSMHGCKQHITHHREGDVLTHTDMVVEEALKITADPKYRDILDLAALCHDLGKPLVTEWKKTCRCPKEHDDFICGDKNRKTPWDEDTQSYGKWTAYKHNKEGVIPTRKLLAKYGFDQATKDAVAVLVQRHLDPWGFMKQDSGDKAYRKLRKELMAVNLPPEVLVQLALADHRGRTADDPAEESELDEFLKKYHAIDIAETQEGR